jgi:pyruvate formate lyase activating enzyme
LNVNKNNDNGIIFNIQKYSIHDGPGIRTTIFVKGCPLRCKWCANPESINPIPEIFFRREKCDQCAKCLDVCNSNAIIIDGESIEIDTSKCDLCLKCEAICSSGAISCTGRKVSVDEVIFEAMQDEVFYNNSGGGITISGGEPLFQPDFTIKLLKEFKDKAIHTTIDTTGYASWEVIDKILNYTDLILYDIKHLDPRQHFKFTGVYNEMILSNLEKILKKRARIWIRVPVIPEFNDSKDYMQKLAKYLEEKPIEKVSLLPYHEWGKHKYKYLGRVYPFRNAQFIDQEVIKEFKNILKSSNLKVTTEY